MQEEFEAYKEKYLDVISKNIKAFREAKGYSQETLSEMINCSREFVNRVENRKEDVSLKTLFKLAYHLDVSPESFYN